MVFSNPKKLSNMTIDEAKRIIEEKCECKRCDQCLANQRNWEDVDINCTDVAKKAVERAFAQLEEYKKELKELEKEKELWKEQEGAPSIVFTLPYKQTIKFMKSKGYTHCYMCGASLYKKEN